MGSVIILPETTKYPISMIGKMAGICWGSEVDNDQKNYKRGLSCIDSEHGRTFEYPDVYMKLEGYSARVIREWYTHIGGAPTRLQASTRYIDYKDFDYVVPLPIKKNMNHELGDPTALDLYEEAMNSIKKIAQELERLEVAREDIAMILPLGMKTDIVCKHNLRNLADMSRQRMCGRAYHEFRTLFHDLTNALCGYSAEWVVATDKLFKPKCLSVGYCPEKNSCGFFENRDKNSKL